MNSGPKRDIGLLFRRRSARDRRVPIFTRHH